MASLNVRGITFSVQRAPRLSTRDVTESLVVVDPPPQPSWQRRSLDKALEFLGTGLDRPRPPAKGADVALADRIASIPWYHTIELSPTITTPGRFDHRDLVPHYGFPADLTGWTALDVATFDGFWAFEMERRGATVTALDLPTTRDVDFPPAVRRRTEELPGLPVMGEGFAIAKEALGARAERIAGSVYDLDPKTHGTFDLVHCGDLLVHLRDPLRALTAMRSVTGRQLLLCDGIDLAATRRSAAPTTTYLGGWEDVVWWLPSLHTLAQMVIDAGFADVEVNSVYNLAKTYDESGYWRASITAHV